MLNTWYKCHKRIGELLVEFYNKHGQKTPQKLMYLFSKDKKGEQYNWAKSIRETYETDSLDPIQIYASFSSSRTSLNERGARLQRVIRDLGSKEKIEQNAAFFNSNITLGIGKLAAPRSYEVQLEIWESFKEIFELTSSTIDQKLFNKLNEWYGLDMLTYTSFLYWIRSDLFCPLDVQTKIFLNFLQVIKNESVSYETYSNLINDALPDDWRAIVYASQLRDEELRSHENENLRALIDEFVFRKNGEKFFEDHSKSSIRVDVGFRIVAITQLEVKGSKHKNLVSDIPYVFYKNFVFSHTKPNEIEFLDRIENSLYNLHNMNVSVCAIVGKNGSGKSALSELFLMIMNELSFSLIPNPKVGLTKNNIRAELYVFTTHLFKIVVKDKLEVYQYDFDQQKSVFYNPKEVNLQFFGIDKLFYSIVANYSLYGLNTLHLGNWIKPLFHKNDGYQVPVVLNPKRDKGNIDINTEEYLAKTRLLINLLNLSLENEADKSDYLFADNKPELIKLTFNTFKIDNKKKLWSGINLNSYIQSKFHNVLHSFGIDYDHLFIQTGIQLTERVEEYCLLKLVEMGMTYSDYYKYVELSEDGQSVIDFKDIEAMVKTVLNDSSHSAFKFKQAFNYLKFGHLIGIIEEPITLQKLSSRIRKVQIEFYEKQGLSIPSIELIPPSFFTQEIIFENGSDFEGLSSGEKQKILSINGILYHLYNLDSVEVKNNKLKYPYVNILLDEIELYFHPDMQRTYVKDILKGIESLKLTNILGVNITFITHSPFILSDIPSKNALHIEDGKPDSFIGTSGYNETFGANIHELLDNDFFLKNGFMGEFAKSKINNTIRYLTIKMNVERLSNIPKEPRHEFEKLKQESLEKEIEYLINSFEIIQDAEFHRQIIDLIGEPILKKKLKEMYDYGHSNN